MKKNANQSSWEARELATSNQLVMYKVEIDHTDDGVKNAVISWLKEGLEAEFFDVTSAGFEAIQAVAAEYWITNKGGQRVAKGVPILVAPPGRAKIEEMLASNVNVTSKSIGKFLTTITTAESEEVDVWVKVARDYSIGCPMGISYFIQGTGFADKFQGLMAPRDRAVKASEVLYEEMIRQGFNKEPERSFIHISSYWSAKTGSLMVVRGPHESNPALTLMERKFNWEDYGKALGVREKLVVASSLEQLAREGKGQGQFSRTDEEMAARTLMFFKITTPVDVMKANAQHVVRQAQEILTAAGYEEGLEGRRDAGRTPRRWRR